MLTCSSIPAIYRQFGYTLPSLWSWLPASTSLTTLEVEVWRYWIVAGSKLYRYARSCTWSGLFYNTRYRAISDISSIISEQGPRRCLPQP